MFQTERDEQRRQFFDQVADGWEDRNYSLEQKRRVEKMVSGLALRDGMTLLDAGCGQGVLLPFLRAFSGENTRLIALDTSAAMLKAVAAKDAHAVALHAAAERIPLIDGYVDRIICFSAFPHFSDKAVAAKEFYRVLKPGGIAYVLHLDSREMINRHHDAHQAVEGDHLPCENGMRIIFSEAGFSHVILDEQDAQYRFSATKQETAL